MTSSDIAIKDPDDRESALILSYIECGDEKQAAIDAGYAESSANQVAKRVLARPHVAWALAIAVRKRLASAAPMALRTLENLAKSGESEKVRLEAAKALLDRAGHVAPRAVAAPSKEEKPLHEQTTDELRAMASRLEGELAGRAKPVSSAQAAPQESQGIDLIG